MVLRNLNLKMKFYSTITYTHAHMSEDLHKWMKMGHIQHSVMISKSCKMFIWWIWPGPHDVEMYWDIKKPHIPGSICGMYVGAWYVPQSWSWCHDYEYEMLRCAEFSVTELRTKQKGNFFPFNQNWTIIWEHGSLGTTTCHLCRSLWIVEVE